MSDWRRYLPRGKWGLLGLIVLSFWWPIPCFILIFGLPLLNRRKP